MSLYLNLEGINIMLAIIGIFLTSYVYIEKEAEEKGLLMFLIVVLLLILTQWFYFFATSGV